MKIASGELSNSVWKRGSRSSHSLRRHTCIILRMHGLIVALWRFGSVAAVYDRRDFAIQQTGAHRAPLQFSAA